MKSGQKGNIAELVALTELLKAGAQVAIPYGNCPGYDLLAQSFSGRWIRVQVKTAYKRASRKGTTYVDFLRGSGSIRRRQYAETDFDVLVAVRPDGHWWAFSVREVAGKRCTTVDGYSNSYRNLGWLK